MKYKILLVLLSIVLYGCATVQDSRAYPIHVNIDDEFTPYIKEFEFRANNKEVSKKLTHITMGFKDYPGTNTVGVCYRAPWFREIDISKRWWNENTDRFSREELIFHELGHCILNRSHTSVTEDGSISAFLEKILFKLGVLKNKGYLKDGCPQSYMHPYTVGSYCIEQHYDYYMKELFNSEIQSAE